MTAYVTALIVLNGVVNPASLLLRLGGRGKGGLDLGRDRARSLSFVFLRSISDHQSWCEILVRMIFVR